MRNIEDCRPYVEHLRIAHEHLHEMLHLAHESLDELCQRELQQRLRAEPFLARLRELRDELARHYDEEEAGGCLEEAQSRCPSIAEEVKRVEAEHPLLRREMDVLVGKAQKLISAGDGFADFRHDFEELAARLRQHEAAENRILLYGFGAEAMDQFMEDTNQGGLEPCACRSRPQDAVVRVDSQEKPHAANIVADDVVSGGTALPGDPRSGCG